MSQEMTPSARREMARGGEEATRETVLYAPDTDIYETETHVVVVADMPGVPPEDVDIGLERRVLTIHGRVRREAHEGYRRLHSEYGEGDFERVFTLSEEIDQDRIEASHRNGVLTVRLPKADAVRARRIEVRAA
jgi:HSP20 family protein